MGWHERGDWNWKVCARCESCHSGHVNIADVDGTRQDHVLGKVGMLSYFLSRRRLSRSFELCNDGYLYRLRPTAEAVLVTTEERAQILRTFRSAYWKHHAILWVSFILLILAAVGIAAMLGAPDEARTAIGYAVVAFLFVAIIYVDRRVIAVATASLGHRGPVKPGRKWLQVVDERLPNVAWWRLIAGGIFLLLLAWLTQSILTASLWGGIAWVCYFGFCFGMWTRNVWRKWQMEARN